MLDLIKDGTISGKIAKDVFDIMFDEGGESARSSSRSGGSLRSPTSARSSKRWIRSSPPIPTRPSRLRRRPALAGWFVGQVMKATGGKASPQAVNDLVKSKLGIE